MFKRMLTSLVALVLMTNAVAAFTFAISGQEECTDACCAVAHCEAASQMLPTVPCCAINSQQDSEPNPLQSLPIEIQKQELKTSSGAWQSQTASSCLLQTRFPSSPTRHLAGSSSRYLENSTFLI